MYLMPYKRQEKLCSENKRFLASLKVDKASFNDLLFYREVEKNKITLNTDKEQRFPSLSKIHKYVSSCQKTNDFCERMTQTIEQIRKYIHETYEQSYIVDYGKLISRVQKNDDVLIKACKIAGIHLTLAELKLPSGTVKYTEQPDSKVIQLADDLLQVASDLLEKYKMQKQQRNLKS